MNGLPVIASRIPGLDEVAREGENALTVPVHARANQRLEADTNALTKAILRLAGNEPLRQKLGRNGRKMWQERFRIKRMAEKTLALYRTL